MYDVKEVLSLAVQRRASKSYGKERGTDKKI